MRVGGGIWLGPSPFGLTPGTEAVVPGPEGHKIRHRGTTSPAELVPDGLNDRRPTGLRLRRGRDAHRLGRRSLTDLLGRRLRRRGLRLPAGDGERDKGKDDNPENDEDVIHEINRLNFDELLSKPQGLATCV